jgi:hypothetical protein
LFYYAYFFTKQAKQPDKIDDVNHLRKTKSHPPVSAPMARFEAPCCPSGALAN